MSTLKSVLDPCCGSRKFYFDKSAPYVLYGDVRDESYVQCDGRMLEVHPDQQMDVTNLPFENESFALVVFDPPPSQVRRRTLIHAPILRRAT